MSTNQRTARSILRRRGNVSADFEALLDGFSVCLLSYVLSIHYVGAFRLLDLLFTLSLLAAMTVSYDALGIYRRHGAFGAKAGTLARAWTLSFAIIVILGYATGMLDHFTRAHIGVYFIVGLVAQLALHFGTEIVQRKVLRTLHKEDALVVGEGSLADYVSGRINSNPWVPESVIGAVTLSTANSNAAEGYDMKLPVLGTTDDIDKVLDTHKIKTVYIITSPDKSSVIRKLYFALLDRSINIHWVPNVYALSLINLNVKEIAGVPVITLSESPLSGRALILKTILDKLLASLALVLSSPILILVALAIKFDSTGPVFFFQKRTGWDGKIFEIWKFRTMYVQTHEDDTVKQATVDDARVTRVGRFMRRTSIDELPQLINVLLGTMSLVGPRPHAIQHNDDYSKKIAAYLARHRIKPGITGLAQVRGLRGETKDLRLMEERVKSDIEYINNWSILLDLSILIRTVLVVAGPRAY